jgi:hypothetical protein
LLLSLRLVLLKALLVGNMMGEVEKHPYVREVKNHHTHLTPLYVANAFNLRVVAAAFVTGVIPTQYVVSPSVTVEISLESAKIPLTHHPADTNLRTQIIEATSWAGFKTPPLGAGWAAGDCHQLFIGDPFDAFFEAHVAVRRGDDVFAAGGADVGDYRQGITL